MAVALEPAQHKNMEQLKNTKIWNSSKTQKYGTAQKTQKYGTAQKHKIWNSSKTQKYATAQKHKNMQPVKKDLQDHYSKASDERLLGDLL